MKTDTKIVYGCLIAFAVIAIIAYALDVASGEGVYFRSDFFVELFLIALRLTVAAWLVAICLAVVKLLSDTDAEKKSSGARGFLFGGLLILLIGTSLCFGAIGT